MRSCTLSAEGSTLTFTERGQLRFSPARGQEWQSFGPFCILHYYDRQHPRAQTVLVPWDDSYALGTAGTPSLSAKSALEVASATNCSLRLKAIFETIQLEIGIDIDIRADGSGFSVSIDDAGIREENPRLYRILGLELLPDFGAAKTGEDGYLVLPNWFGCQTFFNKDYPREVRQTIYSSNDQWEHVCNMPFFGINRAQGTMCGLVAKGDYDAQLICRVHWENEHTNSIHPYLVYRWQQQDAVISGPREVRYTFAPANYEFGEGYVFCAKEYRSFLTAERGLKTWAEKEAVRPEATDYLDRFFLKIFMAYKDPHPQGKGEYHATCTFEEARQILEACQARGMKKIAAMLVGWGQGGHDGMPPTRFPVDERLGGEAGMRALLDWCRENDVLLGVHDSYGASYNCSPEHNEDDLIRHRTGEYWESVIWSGGQAHMLCPRIWLDKHCKRDIPAVAALGIHGHHHIDAVGSFMTCYSKDHPLSDRREFVSYVRQMFEFAIEQMGSVSTEMPFGPYFDVVDGFFHSYVNPWPWHLASPLGKWFFDRSIPLISIALHGSVNCGMAMSPSLDYRLECVDLGLSPQYEVCVRGSETFGIPEYEARADDLATTYAFFYGPDGVLQNTSRARIEGRWERSPKVTETLYDNGVLVRVNRSESDYGDLPAMSYRIEEQE